MRGSCLVHCRFRRSALDAYLDPSANDPRLVMQRLIRLFAIEAGCNEWLNKPFTKQADSCAGSEQSLCDAYMTHGLM